MKRRQFVTSAALAASSLTVSQAQKPDAQKAVYEWRTYEPRYGAPQSGIENYIKDALMPALNRQGVKSVGAFREMGKSDPAKLHVLIAHPSFEAYTTAYSRLAGDQAFNQASQAYTSLAPEKTPFIRYTTSLMSAFDGLPQLVVPAKETRIFELRTYEGHNEDAVRRKIKMFNVDEISIFNKVKLNPVFFGEVIAGEHMPCLTYMLTFKNMEERDANWKQFGADADWKRVSQLPEYANTVSNIIRIFLEPTAYSQI